MHWSRSGQSKLTYQDHQRGYSKSLRGTSCITVLFTSFKKVLASPSAGITDKESNNFMDFFKTKSTIFVQPSPVPSPLPFQLLTHSLGSPGCCALSQLSHQWVEDIIWRMKPSTTCALDPFPTALVKAHIPAIISQITTAIKQSLQAVHVPSNDRITSQKNLL